MAIVRQGAHNRTIDAYRPPGRSTCVALSKGEKFLPPDEIEAIARQESAGAQADGSRSLQGIAYGHLAQAADARGQAEEVAKYRRWQEEPKASDGLIPQERRGLEIAFAKEMIQTSRNAGNGEAARMFEAQFRRLEEAG